MVAGRIKMGFRLALGQVEWSAPLEQEAIYYRKFAWHMATCAMDIVHTHGLAALSRPMYTQVGSPKCTREDGGVAVCCGTVAFDLWDRIKMHEHQSGKPGGRRAAVFGHPMSVCQVAWRVAWNDIVHALPLVAFCGHSGEVRATTPNPLWRRCMWKKYRDSVWADCNTFGHRQQVQ